ncbi:MAG TPA: PTS glucose transporter subunit IIA [Anaerolineaceae bacterium]|nr:PTS glucose transporter subunit IIA [Anaerolineaceae bacterium]
MINIFVPCTGDIVDVTTINDEVFKNKMLGDGMAVIPNGSLVFAPIDGKIVSIFPSNHQFTMKTDDGLELLIHIGIDTYDVKKRFLVRLVEENQYVMRGTPVIKAKFNKLRAKGYDTSVIVVVLNHPIFDKTKMSKSESIDTVLFSI